MTTKYVDATPEEQEDMFLDSYIDDCLDDLYSNDALYNKLRAQFDWVQSVYLPAQEVKKESK